MAMDDVGSVPYVRDTGGSAEGWGGMGMLGLIAIMAMFGGGFGGFGGRRDGAGFVDASVIENGIMDRVDARFNSLENMNEFRSLTASNERGFYAMEEQIRDNCDAICQTRRDILEEGHKNALIEKDTQLQIALGFKDAELRAQECCCDTNRHIDAVQYDLATKLAECCCANRMDTERILASNAAIAGQFREQALIDKIHNLEAQVAKPAYIQYPSWYSYIPPINAVNPPYGFAAQAPACANSVAF
jgi:hypothetical protein